MRRRLFEWIIEYPDDADDSDHADNSGHASGHGQGDGDE